MSTKNSFFTVDFEDLASNAGTQVIALTAEDLDGGVTFDKTPPFFNQTIGGEVGSVTISSNNANGNTNLAKIGDQITLSFSRSFKPTVRRDAVPIT